MKTKKIKVSNLPESTAFSFHNEKGELELFALDQIEMDEADKDREITFSGRECQDPDFGYFFTYYTGKIDGMKVSYQERI